MARVLLLSTPIFGHVQPMITIGRALAVRGHRVCVLTGGKYEAAARSAGLHVHPLPASVDYDDARLHDWLPARGLSSRIAAGRQDILELFVRPLVEQYRAVADVLSAEPADLVIGEAGFYGVLPLLLAERSSRPPVLGVSTTPLSVTSVDCAPFGSGLAPGRTAFSRLRNRQIDYLLRHGPLRAIRTQLDASLAAVGAPPCPVSFFDVVTLFDQTFHLSAAELEYPRRELTDRIRFVGPLPPTLDPPPARPVWWPELAGPRPVVHVTQGTLDNRDLGKLIVPTVRGLAGEPLLVVVTTGGRPVADLSRAYGGPLPANVRVAEFLPYPDLLPLAAAVVTNGGYGGVQQALANGCPLVVAGGSEDKPEVATRVAWAGAGVNLRTGRPSPRQVRAAVRAVLVRSRYRVAAGELRRRMALLPDPVATVVDEVERRVGPPARRRGLVLPVDSTARRSPTGSEEPSSASGR